MIAQPIDERKPIQGGEEDERGSGRVEPRNCGQCPFWTASDRSPGVGRCSQFDEPTIDWEIPGDLCIVLFWQFVGASQPAHAAI